MKNAKKTLRTFVRNRNLLIGTAMILLVVLAALFADWIAPYGYDEANLDVPLCPPCGAYPFGTDEFGRDMFSRVIYGSRTCEHDVSVISALQAAQIPRKTMSHRSALTP